MRAVARRAAISIHALHEESDLVGAPLATFQPLFQSTLSMRRATRVPAELVHTFVISIHALHEESDSPNGR